MEYKTFANASSHPLKIPRILIGLWQLAGGHEAEDDLCIAVDRVKEIAEKGLYAFDMADRECLIRVARCKLIQAHDRLRGMFA